ncbi:hypothetical protein [Barnesiella sp. CU968]|jgi:hypothetical protein|uniref:hypothetical protein n=1 Tax=Barnesiella sp. CU968 TaxID=2780099 RepID=UPI00195D6290|nr:hypothetical protein [Barnesiella sp. CU968]MBJ2198085.1 hypothetical protein [Muribaculaceae bacterium]MCI9029998.1 hypothetical protein [Muribaculaceae bacterium]
MSTRNIDKVDLLLSKLDKTQIADFIRKECCNSKQLQDRFLALGAGTLFKPDSAKYASRVEDLIEDYSDRHGYIDYRATFDFNCAVSRILDEAEDAMRKGQWEVAVAVLTGVASISEDILNSGDDSAGELGAIVSACFEKWHELCANETLPEDIKAEIFELALSRFFEKDLKGWDWWWDWMEMAISLADTSEKQSRIIKALDAIKPNGDSWSAKHNAETAQKYKLEIMSKSGSPEDQIKFMYDNVSNPDFRNRLIQMAWDKADYDEVLRLAGDGVNHDAKYAGLVSDWHKWKYKAYHEIGDKVNELQLARHFFFKGGIWGEKEYSMESMYSSLKTLVSKDEWKKYVETLISEAQGKKDIIRLLYICTQEKMWQEYMDYVRKNPSIYNIDDAPKEVKKLFKDEIVKLYAAAVRNDFQRASNRDSYREGVTYLRKLIKYGGTKEAEQIVTEQKSRTPRRPALIDELSKL